MLKRIEQRKAFGNFYGIPEPLSGAERLNCADLYAGAGGFSLAALNVGLSIKFAVEFDPHACSTYRSNLCGDLGPQIYQEDARKLDPIEIASEHFSCNASCDLLLGGPPCQGYSVHRINGSGVDDPRNELLIRYFDFVGALRPKVFLMENVPGMLWPRHENYVDRFYEEARKAEYIVAEPIVLEVADFGVPQRRKRVFILGIRNDVRLDLHWPPPVLHSENPDSNRGLKEWRKAADVFRDPSPEADPNDVHMNHGPELISAFKKTPANGGSRAQSGRVLRCHKKHDGHKDVYGRIDTGKPGPTMTTACINPSKGRFVHPTEHHGITIRQAARFQTFPDSFIFEGGLIASGGQIGNAVPVVMGEILIREIAKALLRKP